MKTRTHNGLLQLHIEEVGGRHRWKYWAVSFGHTTANMFTPSGETIALPIDDRNRITIAGRKVGERYWHH